MERGGTRSVRCPRPAGAAWLGLALAAALCAGCRSNCDLVEAELRAREGDVRELRDELGRCQVYNLALQQELKALRGSACGPGGPGGPASAYPVRSLALGRGTGGHPGSCGDDGLEVMVEPRDPEGQAIKVPGSLSVLAVEIDSQGLKRPLSSWEVPPDQMRKAWRSGLISTGYSLVLPWKVWPSTEKVRVVAQFKMLDGRTFEADKDVTVRVVPASRRPAPAGDPSPAPAPSQQGPVLPAPMEDPSFKAPPPKELPAPRKMDPGVLGGDAAVRRPVPRTQSVPPSAWRSVEPPPPPPAAEILRPVVAESH